MNLKLECLFNWKCKQRHRQHKQQQQETPQCYSFRMKQ